MYDLLDSARFFFNQGIAEITPDVLTAEKRGQPTREELEATNDLLVRNKMLSQLIAQSYLPGKKWIRSIFAGDQEGIQDFLVEKKIITANESKHSRFDVDFQPSNPPPFLGSVIEGPTNAVALIFKIPFPTRPDQLTDEQLNSWLTSPLDSEPWTPDTFSIWIPYSC